MFPNLGRIAEEFASDGAPVDPKTLPRAEARARFELDRAEIVAGTDDAARWAAYMEGIARWAGAERMPIRAFARLRAYHDDHNLWESLSADAMAALPLLGQYFHLGVISNSNGTLRSKLTEIGVDRLFEVIVDSHDEGIEKPDPRLFEVALTRMGVPPTAAVYVGDSYHVDVLGARASGLEGILLDPFDWYSDKPVRRIRRLNELASLKE